ncbi:hypothetical protein D0U04_25175 [Bacillus clarus]|uniref:Integrase core domain protein n=1 Tax=Bacillus clarus TaxID=2338372 RepID=A0A090YSH6_9BACI|nr:integrase core domain protein [Bacillus clarus]RFT63410.1 hypothetical protein D0U04_25175 [Bacillus clarus]
MKTLAINVVMKKLYDIPKGVIGSHSRKGKCHDNACIESFFSHFKSEIFSLNYYQTKGELIQAIETYIYHYSYK